MNSMYECIGIQFYLGITTLYVDLFMLPEIPDYSSPCLHIMLSIFTRMNKLYDVLIMQVFFENWRLIIYNHCIVIFQIIYNHCIVIFQIDRLIAIKNPIFHLCRVTNSLSVKGEWLDKIINFLQIILVIVFAKIWILLIIGGQAFLDPEVVKGEFSV